MLHRVNFVLMIIVLLAVGATSYQMYMAQKNNTQAIQAVTDELAVMKDGADAKPKGFVVIVGDLPGQGVYALRPDGKLVLSNLMFMAGLDKLPVNVKIEREVNGSKQTVSSRLIESVSDLSRGILLRASDRVTVKSVEDKVGQTKPKERVTITGSVNAAGIYLLPFDKKLTLGDMLVKAGGPSDRAVQINLIREINGKRQTIVQETISLASEIGRLTHPLAPNDRIEVKPVLAYLPVDNSRSMGLVYLDGKIRRPGAYDLKPGRNMTVSKLISEAGGLSDSPVVVRVWRTDAKGKNVVVSQTINDLSEITRNNILLKPDDQIILSPVDSY